MELRAYLSYRRKKLHLTYWRSKSGHEVDFLIGTRTAIEVKTSRKISKNDLKGLKYLKEEDVFKNLILVSQDPVSTLTENILAVPWQKFLSDLWKDEFV
jgi:predicted AAA+ superfamily ATPase